MSTVLSNNATTETPFNGSVPELRHTMDGKPVTWFVEREVEEGRWREEILKPEITGLSREVAVFRSPRRTNHITHDWHGDDKTFCPPMWWDLAIGSGACHFRCRSCFLLLTHRIRRDPNRHLLYDNLADFEAAAVRWLVDPQRRRQHTLGVGIDRSDSLLYEGVAPHVRSLAPLFGSSERNPLGNKLVLLTKSANTHFLEEITPANRSNILVTFSLNPEEIADLWEGKYTDTRERITPTIEMRLQAAKFAQDLGFEVRVRIDPILTPEGWQDLYRQFVSRILQVGLQFRYWTLGTYREKNDQLDRWRDMWDLPEMEWHPAEGELVRDGTHRHMSTARRVEIYSVVRDIIRGHYPQARVSLCKETHEVRRAVALCNADCNCLI